jgi:phosphoglucomutase
MPLSPLAGLPAPPELLIDPAQLERLYYDRQPDTSDPAQLVSFGTSGHRGTPLNGTFTESHILAITQAICEYRKQQGIAGPLIMGKDTHAASGPAQRTALEVLAANYVETIIQEKDAFTPTPVVSHAILTYNRGLYGKPGAALADGIVITPSHNPPEDGGFKYNPPDGGPADTNVTSWIQDRANRILHDSCIDVKRIPYESALRASTTHQRDLARPYIEDLGSVIDIAAIRTSGPKIGVDPLGGSSLAYWEPIAEHYGLNLTVVNPQLDPRFAFMTVDHDGKIRMDCSSPYAMAGLAKKISAYDIAWGNDPDADRHGIVTRSAGLLNPNHYLAVAIDYLLSNRPNWPKSAVVGKTVVSSSMIDRVVADRQRTLWEVPVGFKWFAPGLFDGKCCFGGEESAGASFLRRDGTVWTTDKDGLILGLLSAEICARTSRDPGELYNALVSRFGEAFYTRIDAPATRQQREALKHLEPKDLSVGSLAGDSITATLTNAPGNNSPIGGLKVVTAGGWFAARPSGTEDVCKLYAESLRSAAHLDQIVAEAQSILARVLTR